MMRTAWIVIFGLTATARAGAQLTINLTGAMPLNFAAAYSDYHVTGLNPAGNASLTNLAFVTSRFCITQSRRPAVTADKPNSVRAEPVEALRSFDKLRTGPAQGER